MNSLIFSYFSYCITSWSQAGKSTLRPLYTLYKCALKVFDKKPYKYHHCLIINKYHFFTFDNFIVFYNCCLMYKILNNLAPSPLKEFVFSCTKNIRQTRASSRDDCAVHFRATDFGRSAFSVRAVNNWNNLPITIRQCSTLAQFKIHLKIWLKMSQVCDH